MRNTKGFKGLKNLRLNDVTLDNDGNIVEKSLLTVEIYDHEYNCSNYIRETFVGNDKEEFTDVLSKDAYLDMVSDANMNKLTVSYCYY